MRISISIMADSRRAEMVGQLVEQLPTALVTWDRYKDRWDTGRRAMLAYEPTADWHLVVQDDAVLCGRFVESVEAALAAVKHGPVAFYLGRTDSAGFSTVQATKLARRNGYCWINGPGPMWGVAIAVRPYDIPAMIAWGDEHSEIPNYDIRLARYFASVKRSCLYSVPSLVDHRVGPSNPSLIDGRGSSLGRTAVHFAGPTGQRTWNTKIIPRL